MDFKTVRNSLHRIDALALPIITGIISNHGTQTQKHQIHRPPERTSEQIEIINQSIVNGWTGLYPLKQETFKQTRKEPVPSWMPKNQHNYDFDAIEKKLLGINDDPSFVAEREALQKELQEKYGK